MKLREKSSPEMFIPFLFASQPCEHLFRQMRSMGQINYTKINFTLIELLHLIARVEMQNDIVYSKLPNMKFPRAFKSTKIPTIHNLPSNDDIIDTIRKARDDALSDAIKFNIIMSLHDIENCELQKIDVNSNTGKRVNSTMTIWMTIIYNQPRMTNKCVRTHGPLIWKIHH